MAQQYLNKARQTLIEVQSQGFADALDVVKKLEIEGFMRHASALTKCDPPMLTRT